MAQTFTINNSEVGRKLEKSLDSKDNSGLTYQLRKYGDDIRGRNPRSLVFPDYEMKTDVELNQQFTRDLYALVSKIPDLIGKIEGFENLLTDRLLPNLKEVERELKNTQGSEANSNLINQIGKLATTKISADPAPELTSASFDPSARPKKLDKTVQKPKVVTTYVDKKDQEQPRGKILSLVDSLLSKLTSSISILANTLFGLSAFVVAANQVASWGMGGAFMTRVGHAVPVVLAGLGTWVVTSLALWLGKFCFKMSNVKPLQAYVDAKAFKDKGDFQKDFTDLIDSLGKSWLGQEKQAERAVHLIEKMFPVKLLGGLNDDQKAEFNRNIAACAPDLLSMIQVDEGKPGTNRVPFQLKSRYTVGHNLVKKIINFLDTIRSFGKSRHTGTKWMTEANMGHKYADIINTIYDAMRNCVNSPNQTREGYKEIIRNAMSNLKNNLEDDNVEKIVRIKFKGLNTLNFIAKWCCTIGVSALAISDWAFSNFATKALFRGLNEFCLKIGDFIGL